MKYYKKIFFLCFNKANYVIKVKCIDRITCLLVLPSTEKCFLLKFGECILIKHWVSLALYDGSFK